MRERLESCLRQGSQDAEATAQVELMCRANGSPTPFEIDESTINARMTDAAKWVATTSAAEVMAWREATITDFEDRAKLVRGKGLCDP